jgi:hypothetical protein
MKKDITLLGPFERRDSNPDLPLQYAASRFIMGGSVFRTPHPSRVLGLHIHTPPIFRCPYIEPHAYCVALCMGET